jgi:putative Mn2+ efflux pump MntP
MLTSSYFRGFLLATLIMSVNMAISLVIWLLTGVFFPSDFVGLIASLESGFLLVFGGCLASRQPLSDEDSLKPDGSPTSSFRIGNIGKQLLFCAVFIFLFGAFFSILGYIIGF